LSAFETFSNSEVACASAMIVWTYLLYSVSFDMGFGVRERERERDRERERERETVCVYVCNIYVCVISFIGMEFQTQL